MSNEQNIPDGNLDKKLNLRDMFTPPTYEQWREVVEKDLKGVPFEKKLVTKTYEGINLQPAYRREDIKDLPLKDDKPGFGSYVRSTKIGGYIEKPWDIAQEIPYGDAEEFNDALKYDLKRGQTAINIVLDEATKLGLDADYAKPEQVGKGGLSFSAILSMKRAFKDIDLTKYPVYVDAGYTSTPFISLFAAYLKKENINIADITGSIDADPIGYLAETGELPISLENAYDELKSVTEWATKNASGIKTIHINAAVYNNAGAGAVQELAYALSTAVEYISQLTERGLKVEDIASKIRFTFGIGPNYFMEIAKLRAVRVLWAKVLESYGVAADQRKMFIHAKASQFNQTVYDPYVNMLRTTTEAFSAVVGGVDSMHTNPFDETIGLPDSFSRRIARNTQIILKEESHLDQLIDPAGGSYYVEWLTNEVAKKAWELFGELDEKGGIVETLKSGEANKKIAAVNEARAKDFKKRKEVLVGTNMYANMTEKKITPKVVDHKGLHEKRTKYLQAYRISGDNGKHESILAKLQQLVDKSSADVITVGAEAYLEGATIGEISKAVFANPGEKVTADKIKTYRIAEIFEELRDASLAYQEKTGSAPKIFLATMGSLKQHKARADFSRGFFEAGGFNVIYPKGFDTPEAAAKEFAASRAKVAVLCSTDDTYPELVDPFVKAAKTRGDVTVILAGYPKDKVEEYKAAGVDDFIYLGADVYAIISELLKNLGAL
ncbi:MAG: methylmalonyl-CoA mutase [Melioribacteraceae bacterium]|nr:MAG: methylmalonyl-CoA mutase [Melioribacteraceae bacterium]